MAMVQACTAEFLAMQTAIDQSNLKMRANLLGTLYQRTKPYDEIQLKEN